MEKKFEEFRDLILKKEKEGKIVFMSFDGPCEINLDAFIKQPAEGILYDLNRNRATVLTFIDDPKWVNDFAVGLVIARLKREIDELKESHENATPPAL